jgi:hypothetical protein
MGDHYRYLKYKKKYIELKKNQKGGYNGSDFPIDDEIHFWGRQMTEHLLILFLGLEDDGGKLKNQAFELYQRWKNFMTKNFYDKGIVVNIETVFLSADDLEKINNKINLSDVNSLIELTIKFKSQIISILDQGKWIGWIYPSLAKHMLQEAEYFNRKVNGPAFTVTEEIQFSNHHHSTEMGATAQLIDPDESQQPIIDVVRSYALKKMSVLRTTGSLSGIETTQPYPRIWTPEEEAVLQGLNPNEETNYLLLSLRFSEELSDFAEETGKKIENNELKSTISPALAHHVHREFVRFTETLRQLQTKNTASITNQNALANLTAMSNQNAYVNKSAIANRNAEYNSIIF